VVSLVAKRLIEWRLKQDKHGGGGVVAGAPAAPGGELHVALSAQE
jgi:hypothetical protein